MIPHIAIPAVRLEDAVFFYSRLGAKIGRKYQTHVVMNFHGIQLVCHKSKKYDLRPEMYPRHFGVIIPTKEELFKLYSQWQLDKYLGSFFFEKLFLREEGKEEEHWTFFLRDHSNNTIEFKAYKNEASIFT